MRRQFSTTILELRQDENGRIPLVNLCMNFDLRVWDKVTL